MRRRTCLTLPALACLSVAGAQPADPRIHNLVRVNPRLLTAGQPNREVLATLRSHGIEAVICLVPASDAGTVRDEAAVLAAQGIEYVDIPIPWEAPEPAHFRAFGQAMARLERRHVLVHCMANLRASTFVFLDRVVRLKHDPATAYGLVAAVWSPNPVWKRLAVQILRENGSRFEPY